MKLSLYCGTKLSGGLYDPPGTDTAGADKYGLSIAVDGGPDLLKVRVPGPSGLVVGVGDVVPHATAFAAYVAYPCHELNVRAMLGGPASTLSAPVSTHTFDCKYGVPLVSGRRVAGHASVGGLARRQRVL